MNSKVHSLVFCALFAALTAVGAFISIPIGVISISLQFFFTILAGLLLGPKLGASSQLLYVLIGLCGIPVFTKGGGVSYIFEPSFGFLLGLIPAAWSIGFLNNKMHYRGAEIVSALAGLCVLYLVGLPYMSFILNHVMQISYSVKSVLVNGMLVFLPGDFIKIFIAALAAPRISKSTHFFNKKTVADRI